MAGAGAQPLVLKVSGIYSGVFCVTAEDPGISEGLVGLVVGLNLVNETPDFKDQRQRWGDEEESQGQIPPGPWERSVRKPDSRLVCRSQLLDPSMTSISEEELQKWHQCLAPLTIYKQIRPLGMLAA